MSFSMKLTWIEVVRAKARAATINPARLVGIDDPTGPFSPLMAVDFDPIFNNGKSI